MDDLLREYLPIVIFLGLAIALGLAFLVAALVLAVRRPDAEKISAYECGFNAFDDARMKFDVRFYLVSIGRYSRRPVAWLTCPDPPFRHFRGAEGQWTREVWRWTTCSANTCRS